MQQSGKGGRHGWRFRAALGTLAVAGAAAAASPSRPAAAPHWRDGLAIQIWAYNDALKNKDALSPVPKIDVPSALSRIKAMGVDQVEVMHVPGYSAAQMRTALDKAGMRAVSVQMDYDRMRDDLPGAIAAAKALGVSQVGISAIKIFGPQGYHLLNIADTEEAGEVLAKACASAQAAGMRTFLHIHGNDLHMLDGKTALDRIIDKAGGCFDIEADIYWIRSAGVDPVAFINKYGAKVTSLHLKDWKPARGTALPFPPLGKGDLNLPAIMKAAQAAGVRHYIIEDESGDPDTQLPQSLTYLASIGK